jgi:hypothetical protein
MRKYLESLKPLDCVVTILTYQPFHSIRNDK